MKRLEMKNYNMISTEKQQIYQHHQVSGKTLDKYEYLTVEETLSPDQSRVIEKAKFTFSPLGKAFEKHKNN